MVDFRFYDRTWDPFLKSKIFFFLKFNLLVQFFGVEFTGNYHAVGIIT